jgi:hypothetical protein
MLFSSQTLVSQKGSICKKNYPQAEQVERERETERERNSSPSVSIYFFLFDNT